MPSSTAHPLLRAFTRARLRSNGSSSSQRIGQLPNRSLRGSSHPFLKSRKVHGPKVLQDPIANQASIQMIELDIGRKSQILSGVASGWEKLESKVQPGLQRRGYQQYNVYPPASFWQRNKPSIVVGGVLGLCCVSFVGNWWAQQRAENFHDFTPLNFIRENCVCSLENVRAGRYWVVLSSSITHFSLLHLGANILTLWSFGPALVASWGAPAFFGIWVTSELCCSIASLWWDQRRDEARVSSMGQRWDKRDAETRKWFVPKDPADPGIMYGGSIGASGAISGMLGAIMCFSPNLKISLFPLPVPFRMWMYTAAFAGWSLYCLDSGTCSWVGHAGHLGGLVGGIASYYGAIRPWLRRMPRL